jgi:hypothetical protein
LLSGAAGDPETVAGAPGVVAAASAAPPPPEPVVAAASAALPSPGSVVAAASAAEASDAEVGEGAASGTAIASIVALLHPTECMLLHNWSLCISLLDSTYVTLC